MLGELAAACSAQTEAYLAVGSVAVDPVGFVGLLVASSGNRLQLDSSTYSISLSSVERRGRDGSLGLGCRKKMALGRGGHLIKKVALALPRFVNKPIPKHCMFDKIVTI